jgi:periplasmic protein TonB
VNTSLYPLREPLDQRRIYAIALNLAVHMALLVWITARLPGDTFKTDEPLNTAIRIDFIEPIEPVTPPPVTPVSTKPKAAMPSLTAAAKKSTSVLPTKILKDATVAVIEQTGASFEIAGSPTTTTEIAAAGNLAYGEEVGREGGGNGDSEDGAGAIEIFNLKPKYSPPPDYPKHSYRNAEQGLVTLLVKVGADGKPIEAKILKSSGFPELDENTRKNILSRWQFYPAMRQGVPIAAYILAKQLYVMNGQVN